MMTAIALLTDFGTKDYFVGAMKGAILSVNSRAQIVDITHDIEPQNIRAAAFTLRACFQDFPPKTIFVAIVDPGVGSARRAILVETEDYFFIAPDNGLLSFVLDEAFAVKNESLSPRVFELKDKKYFAENVSRTFHGRDVFAPVAAHLSNGVAPGKFGREILDYVHFETAAPKRVSANELEGEIIHVDRFGNLVTNFPAADLPAKFSLRVNENRIERHQKYYAEAETGQIFSIAGSAGFLEIGAFQDSARRILQVEAGQKIILQTAR